MSTPGKIFTVLNTILAALFLGWAANNLAQSTNYKEMYDGEVAAKAALQADLDNQVDALRTELSTKEQTVGQLRSDRDGLKVDRDRLSGEVESAESANAALSGDISEIKSSLDSYAQTNKSNADRVDAAVQERNEAGEARRTAEDERESALEAARASGEELQAANNQVASLEREREELRTRVSELDAQLTALAEATGTSLPDIVSMPPIDGSVLQVVNSVEPGLIAINRGTAHGVQRGFTFDIYAGGQYKGQVRVESVQNDMCTAVIVRTYEGRDITQGDRASTRI
ncbi:MAG: uncharacterized coiled-coil DUF342 family protein [Chlamydiales bacterium]|jgi:uncharacterized coiled-coil DUF342 family protein